VNAKIAIEHSRCDRQHRKGDDSEGHAHAQQTTPTLRSNTCHFCEFCSPAPLDNIAC
jgi:hypothetical protein